MNQKISCWWTGRAIGRRVSAGGHQCIMTLVGMQRFLVIAMVLSLPVANIVHTMPSAACQVGAANQQLGFSGLEVDRTPPRRCRPRLAS
jgi:hypothetical protein